MCYVISAIQSLLCLDRFAKEARRVRGGPILDAFKVVMLEMKEGDPVEIFRAMKYLRVRGGQDLGNAYVDHNAEQDSEEWLTTFLSTAEHQVQALQPDLRIVEPINFLERHFEIGLHSVTSCKQ
jgi:hypothetical protein